MKNRILATLVLWALIIILPYFLGKWGAFLLIGVLGAGAFIELLDLLEKAGRSINRPVAMTFFVLLLASLMVIPPWMVPPVAIIFLCLSGILMACLLTAQLGSFTATAIPTLGSVFLLGLPLSAGVLMVHEGGTVLLVWVVAVAKFGDVGALLTGMWIGKHKMAPGYSPNKTWEGFCGGILLSILISIAYVMLFQEWLPGRLTPLHAAWMALFITVSAVMADLMESAFKREAKAKDSGSIVPGIGGLLDLADSMILALPMGYFLIWIVL